MLEKLRQTWPKQAYGSAAGCWTGIDFSELAPDQVVAHVENDAGRTALENITRADPNRR